MFAPNSAPLRIDLICLDGDDTLWHNERHFHRAKATFLDIVRPFVDDETASRTLERTGLRNLATHGYGVKSFTLSMIEAALGARR